MGNITTRVAPPSLPATFAELEAVRMAALQTTDTGKIRVIISKLWEQEQFRKLSYAGYKEHTVTGSTMLDDVRQLDMILDYASQHDIMLNGNEASLLSTMRYVKREFNISRSDRKQASTQLTPDEVVELERFRQQRAARR